ncbi:MAG: Gfo/Idh/MocA family oxidoreductase [Candidatus Omnitrophica bacterium]|nr:Gfo/Idh/MocA family oxidoreductase [Candidatus Omnitrophota bacterium]
MRKIKVGVIGLGYLGKIHARLYKEINTCQLVAGCDIDIQRAKEVSSELGIDFCLEYKELFGKVDAVSIATPTKLHYRIARDFLNNRIHTLVEKPFTTGLKEASALIKIAKRHGLILQVGHVERFNSAFSATEKIIHEPQFIECHRLSKFPNRSLDIGVVLDLMIHDIDIVLGLVKSPVKKIQAVGIPVLTPFEDIANARLTFKNGCVANLTASRISDEGMRKIRIFFKNTYISLDYKNEEAFVYKKTSSGITKTALPIEKEQPLKKELSSFVECVTDKKTPLVSGKIAKDALDVAFVIRNQICKKTKIS